MKIAFTKISSTPQDFSFEQGGVRIEGTLKRKNEKEIFCKASLFGTFEHICDRCGNEMRVNIDENLWLILSDGEYKSNSQILEDVVEFYDGFIDFDELLNSEIESIKSDYFYCNDCKNQIKGE